MSEGSGTTGLVLDEPLVFEKGRPGRSGYSLPRQDVPERPLPESLQRAGMDFPDLSEAEVVRHYTRLASWNFGLDTGMYPLGSCTMKYNPKLNEKQAARPGFAGGHPLLPPELAQGALAAMHELEQYLAEITGMDAVSLQPAAGAQGELAGMLLIHAYHAHRGQARSRILIPDTAHGTNPSSAALCGYQPVPLASNSRGVLDAETVAAAMNEQTAGIMVTNPNTLGFFEENIRAIADVVHAGGGLVYADGANLNAVMGIVKLGAVGADIVHLNLHKTFATPHGGGGPGAGPVCVKAALAPFLPVPRVVALEDGYRLSQDYPLSIGRLQAFHGNFGVLLKALCYIRSLGPGLKRVSELAVLNANYLRERLKEVFHLPYDRPCLHECIFSDKWQNAYKVTTLDMAKRLMDYGFHPPTIYFPLVVPGALMIEPTETESLEELDRFVDACRAIAREAAQNPALLTQAPTATKVRRVNEVEAARHPCLAG